MKYHCPALPAKFNSKIPSIRYPRCPLLTVLRRINVPSLTGMARLRSRRRFFFSTPIFELVLECTHGEWRTSTKLHVCHQRQTQKKTYKGTLGTLHSLRSEQIEQDSYCRSSLTHRTPMRKRLTNSIIFLEAKTSLLRCRSSIPVAIPLRLRAWLRQYPQSR